MNFLPRSTVFGPFRACLLALAFGVLTSTLAASALADGSCVFSESPYQAGVPVQVSASTRDELAGEPYTILWGDGATTSGTASFSNVPLAGEFLYQNDLSASHVYSAAVRGISIVVLLANGDSCTTEPFDVLGRSTAEAAQPTVAAVEYYHAG